MQKGKRIQRIDLRGKYYNLTELTQLRNELAKEVNKNLLALERAKKTQYAYNRAIRNIQDVRGGKKRRYETNKTYTSGELPLLKLEIDEMQQFLDYKTSTVEGATQYEENAVRAMRERGLKVSDPTEFFNFLSSEIYSYLASRKIDSEILQDFWDRAHEEGLSPHELNKLLDQYKKGTVSVKDMYEKAGIDFLKNDRGKYI